MNKFLAVAIFGVVACFLVSANAKPIFIEDSDGSVLAEINENHLDDDISDEDRAELMDFLDQLLRQQDSDMVIQQKRSNGPTAEDIYKGLKGYKSNVFKWGRK